MFKRKAWFWPSEHGERDQYLIDLYLSGDLAIDHDVNLTPRGGDIRTGASLTETVVGSPDSDIFIFADSKITAVGGAGDDVFDMTSCSATIRAGTGADIVTVSNHTGTIDLGADQDGDILIIDSQLGKVVVKNFDVETDLLVVDWAQVSNSRENAAGTFLDFDNGASVFLSGVHDFVG